MEFPDIAESQTCPIQLKSMNGTQSSEVDSAIADVLAKIEAKMELVLAEAGHRAGCVYIILCSYASKIASPPHFHE